MNSLHFSDDQPISQRNQDLLGRVQFSKNMADAICNWKNSESLVIALMGAWGTGKSSIKNMIIEEFKKSKDNQYIEFNPWEWSAQEKISERFFDELSLVIKRKDKSKDGAKLAKAFRKYSRRINSGAAVIEGISTYVPILLTSALAMSYLSNSLPDSMYKNLIYYASFIPIIATAPAFLKKISDGLSNIAKSKEEKSKDDEQTLEEIRKQIITLLSKRNNPLLIVMDDIDRLPPEHIKGLFQLVKGSAQFPNVVFLLLFQREIVEAGLQKSGFHEQNSLEKIIQVPFNVPLLSKLKLQAILSKRLDLILQAEPLLANSFDERRWAKLYRKGLNPLFKNLRDVYRYTSTLQFHCKLLRGRNVAEISAVDLFALEALRVFSPAVYEALACSKDELTTGSTIGALARGKDKVVNLVQRIVDLSPVEQRDQIREIVEDLFPNLHWATKNSSYDKTIKSTWKYESRLCCPEFYDRYFELGLENEEIQNSLILDFLDNINDPNKIFSMLAIFNDEQLIEILTRLEPHIDKIQLENNQNIIESLLVIAKISSGNISFNRFITVQGYVSRMVTSILHRVKDNARRFDLLTDAFLKTNEFSTLESILMHEERLMNNHEKRLLDNDGFTKLKTIFCTKLISHADNDPSSFLSDPQCISHLYRLNNFSNGSGTAWLNNNIKSIDLFILLALSVVKEVASSDEEKSTYKVVHKSTINDMLGVPVWKEWIKKLDMNKLNKSEKEAIQLINETIDLNDQSIESEFD